MENGRGNITVSKYFLPWIPFISFKIQVLPHGAFPVMYEMIRMNLALILTSAYESDVLSRPPTFLRQDELH